MNLDKLKEDKEEIIDKIEEMGFERDHAETIHSLLQVSQLAIEGDAFAQAKLEDIGDEGREGLSTMFDEAGYDSYSNSFVDGKRIYSTLDSFFDEEVEIDG